MKPLRYMLILFGLILLFPLMAISAPAKVALLPYVINADQDLTFLQNGVFDMMSSRFSAANASVIDRNTIHKTLPSSTNALSPAAAREIGQRLGANYVVYGSITKIGNDISLDTKILPVAGVAEPETFSETCKNMGEIIPKLNNTTALINNRYFGGVKSSAPVVVAPAPTPAPQAQGPVYDSRMDPNKLITAGGGIKADVDISDAKRVAVAGQFWKSPFYKEYLTGVAIADVDGCGKNELIVSSKHSVIAYKFENQRLIKAYTLIEKTKNTIVSIDAADINGSGTAQVFISAIGPNLNLMASSVMQYDGKQFKTIVADSPYFYRVVKPMGEMTKRIVLLGQSGIGLDAPYPRNFHELAWTNGAYQPIRTMRISRGQNVLGFSMGIFSKDGGELFLGYNTEEKLTMFAPDGRFTWKGDEPLGGRHEHMNLRETSVSDSENYRYLPMRTLAVDLGDKPGTFITVKNERISNFISFRSFTSGQVLILNWDGLSMDTTSASRKLSGHINDFTVGDFNNDGSQKLVVLNVAETGALVGTSPKSIIVVYDFHSPTKK